MFLSSIGSSPNYSDPPVKQYILFIEKQEGLGSITDIDDTHLFLHSTGKTSQTTCLPLIT